MLYAALGIGAGVLAWRAYLAASGAAGFAASKLNPASDQNFIYDDIIGGAGRYISGNPDWTLGSAIYDVQESVMASPGYLANQANNLNPVKSPFILYDGISWAGRRQTGDQGWTLGGWFYDRYN